MWHRDGVLNSYSGVQILALWTEKKVKKEETQMWEELNRAEKVTTKV